MEAEFILWSESCRERLLTGGSGNRRRLVRKTFLKLLITGVKCFLNSQQHPIQLMLNTSRHDRQITWLGVNGLYLAWIEFWFDEICNKGMQVFLNFSCFGFKTKINGISTLNALE